MPTLKNRFEKDFGKLKFPDTITEDTTRSDLISALWGSGYHTLNILQIMAF